MARGCTATAAVATEGSGVLPPTGEGSCRWQCAFAQLIKYYTYHRNIRYPNNVTLRKLIQLIKKIFKIMKKKNISNGYSFEKLNWKTICKMIKRVLKYFYIYSSVEGGADNLWESVLSFPPPYGL